MKRISSAGPSITFAEIDLVTDAIRDGWGAKMSFYIDTFVDEFKAYTGLPHVLPTAHCTDAIHLAMLALDIGPGDEVIVPDLTWVASASPITYVGAKPIFADIDPDSWCITASAIERCITPRTKAVVVVDLLGNMPEWDDILTVCQKYSLRIIEDAAEGIGATYRGIPAGRFGDVSVFSFNATKLIMSGQGGAFCTRDSSLYKKAKLFSHHGIDKATTGRYYWSNVIGYNYNWTNIQAAIALAQLRRIEELADYKKWVFSEYQKHLCSVQGVRLNRSFPDVKSTYWISVAEVGGDYGLDKESLCTSFEKFQIDMRPMFYPVSSMPPFQKYLDRSDYENVNPISYSVAKRSICLPNGNNLTTDDVAYICQAFKEILSEY